MAFQIVDDILDIEGDSRVLGKQAGADEKRKKITYPAVVGIERARETGRRLVDEAVEDMRDLGPRADPLRAIARYIVEREK